MNTPKNISFQLGRYDQTSFHQHLKPIVLIYRHITFLMAILAIGFDSDKGSIISQQILVFRREESNGFMIHGT